MPCDSPESLGFMMQKISMKLRLDHLQWGHHAGGIGKIAFFDWLRSHWLSRLTAEELCPCTTVVHIHDGALAEEYAVSSTTLLVEVC